MHRWSYSIIMLLFVATAHADLSAFPQSFMTGERFDGMIVLGEGGSPRDYQAGVEIAIGLQHFLGTPATETSDSLGATDNVQIKAAGNMLESGEQASSVLPTLSEMQFTLLANATLENYLGSFRYSQYLNLGPDITSWFGVGDGIPWNDDNIPMTCLVFEQGSMAYEYQLIFHTPYETRIASEARGYGLRDLEEKTISFMGNEYTVISTTHATNNSIILELLGGSVEDMLEEYTRKSYSLNGESYDVEIVAIFVKQGVLKVQMKINGELTDQLAVGETFNLEDRTIVGIKDLLENDGTEAGGADLVKFYLGADKMVLRDDDISDRSYGGHPVQIGSRIVDGTDVNIIGIDPGLVPDEIFTIESISVKWTPSDTHYLPQGKSLQEIIENENQIFTQAFDIAYEGPNMENRFEVIELVPTGNTRYKLRITNKLSHTLEIPLFNGNLSRFGESTRTLHAVEGVPISRKEYFIVTSDGHKPIPTASGYTHLLRYDGKQGNMLAFTDLGRNERIEVRYPQGATEAHLVLYNNQYLIDLSHANDQITVDLNNDGAITAGTRPTLVTQYGMNIDLETNPLTTQEFKRFTIYTKPKESDLALSTLNGALYSVIGPTIQAGYNAAFAGFGLNIAENPVLHADAVKTARDSIRVTIHDAGDHIDITTVERCVDSANPSELREAVTTAYDATIAVIHSMNFLPYPTLSENILATFMDQVCYPQFTTTERFLWDIESDKMGTTTYSNLVELTSKSNAPDTLTILAPDSQIEHLVYVRSPTSDGTSARKDNPTGKISGSALDSEFTQAKHAILIGGPCANQISREAMGNPADCTEGYEPGKGRLTSAQYQGKNVIIISGYSGEDTLKAAMVLANHASYDLSGNDLEVTGELGMFTVGPYVAAAREAAPKTVAPQVEAPAKIEPACSHPNLATGGFAFEIKKLGITKKLEPTPIVETNGLSGTISFIGGETFKSQFGVTWLQYVVHILDSDCSTPLQSLTFKWEEGDNDKTIPFTLPEPGCYCMAVGSADVTIDNAKIEFTSEPMKVLFGAG